jgi:hypothetical protein
MAVQAVQPPQNLFYPFLTNPTGGGQGQAALTAQTNQLGNWMNTFQQLNPSSSGAPGASPNTLRSVNRRLAPTLPANTTTFGSKGTLRGTTPGTTTPGGVPAYDMSKVESMAQRIAAPAVRSLRNTVQDVQQGVYDNPNVKSMTIRQALAGYGQGLESAMSGALTSAAGIYNVPYQAGVQGTLQANQIASNQTMQANQIAATAANQSLQNQWQAYLASLV